MASDEKENVVEEGEEAEKAEEEKPPPTHDPFSLPIVQLVATAQAQNGLRHNDHHRYRQYCYRRLARIRKGLKFHHGRGRFKPAPLPDFFVQPKFLEIPLVCAERAWAYGMQIKADNATSSKVSARSRGHAMRRFGKAVKWAEELKAQVAKHGDARSQKEAAAYAAYLSGCYHVEREAWKEASAALNECQVAYDHLALTADTSAAVHYRTKVKELAPMLRVCTYHLGVHGETAASAAAVVEADMEVTYRGTSVPVVSVEVQAAVTEAQKAVADEERLEKVEKYGTIVGTIDEALQKVHAAMLADADAGATQAAQLKLLEAYLRELTVCSNVERSLVLLRPLPETIGLADEKGKKVQRPEEGVRLCDMANDEFASLSELPNADTLEPGLEGLKVALRNERLLYVGLVNAAAGKVAEAVALFDLLRARLGDVPSAPTPALERVQMLLDEANEQLSSRVAKWRARILAQHELAQQEEPEPVATMGRHFPPKVSPIACKPFVLDLAYQELETPSFEEFIKQKSGLLGKIGGGVGKMAGWFRK